MLIVSRIRAGHWEGVWRGDVRPDFALVFQGKPLPELNVQQIEPGRWQLSAPIPSAILSDGVQTIVLRADGKAVGRVAIVSGEPLEEDLLAEIALLRAELDLLKQSFRRHCIETGT